MEVKPPKGPPMDPSVRPSDGLLVGLGNNQVRNQRPSTPGVVLKESSDQTGGLRKKKKNNFRVG